MRIYKMTATFGKLENQTLTLEPGLNIITAPNEWGKSTWCAFLLAMLYGLDTRAKTTKNALADKERYAPWSGSPMEGRIDLSWKGRDITIARRTKKRVPLGEFSAYETHTGLPVPELTAANCGQVLLGVEQTVFRRAGFVRLSDMPVTQDEALRRRLNDLVTTGDESGAGDRLAESLKDLKNRCRYNRSGLLPQAEGQRSTLEEKLEELRSLELQCQKLQSRLEELKTWQGHLRNHQQALEYAEAEKTAGQLAQARSALDQADRELRNQESICARLPSREDAQQKLQDVHLLREQWNALQLEIQALPQEPLMPEMPEPFENQLPEEARQMVREDEKVYHKLLSSKFYVLMLVLGLLGLIGAGVLVFLNVYLPAAMTAGAALAAAAWSFWERRSIRRQAMALVRKYKTAHTEQWDAPIGEYQQSLRAYYGDLKEYQELWNDLEVRQMVLQRKRDALCADQEPEEIQEFWLQVIGHWDTCTSVRREAARARSHFEALSALVRPAAKPVLPDSLTCSHGETDRLLSEALAEQQRLQNRLGQYQGRMESLGDPEALKKQLHHCQRRIARLEDTYSALTIALESLADARAELQRRFAPRIARRAQELLSAMTAGRYHSLTMGADFSLQAGAGEESTLRDLQWRSEGTMDQLYLSLRLAVAEELTPDAPLVLDDALVRFDDERMKAAVDILKAMGQSRQILCFTCQSRETLL